MKDVTPTLPKPSHEEIATCAYFLWERAGSPSGTGGEFWKQAEEQLGVRFEPDEPAWQKPPTSLEKLH